MVSLTDCFFNGYSLLCQPVDYSPTPLPLKIAHYCYVYYALKVIDLLDTVSNRVFQCNGRDHPYLPPPVPSNNMQFKSSINYSDSMGHSVYYSIPTHVVVVFGGHHSR